MVSTVSYNFTWHVKHRVILAELGGVASLPDVETANKMILGMLEAGTAPVHIIVDCTYLQSVPVNLTQVLNRMTHLQDPNLGYVVAFDVNRFVRFMASAVFPFTKTRLQFVNTREDAITYLRQLDYTVDWNGNHAT